MATLRQDLGPVTAYAYAVSEGYTGTEEEFAEVLANFADSAEQVAADAAQVALDKGAVHDDKEAVDSAEGRVTSAVNTFTTTTAPNAVTAVENAGAAQIGLVEAEGTRQIGLVADKGTEQVGTVSSEGTTQIGLVEAKGAEVIASIPGDYSTLQGDIASTYSSSSTYAVGDYVLYSGQLYRCTTAISTAEAWTSAKWTAVALGDDVRDLKSALTYGLDTGLILVSKTLNWINAYVNGSGVIKSSSVSKTCVVTMYAGETVTVGTQNTNIGIISSTTNDNIAINDTVTIIQKTSNINQYEEYSYTATSTINIVISVKSSDYNLQFTKNTGLRTDIDNNANGVAENKHNIENGINKISTFNLHDVASNVLAYEDEDVVSGTGNYVYKTIYTYSGAFSAGDIFQISYDSVVGASAIVPTVIDVYAGETKLHSANYTYTITSEDITNGVDKVILSLYPAKGTPLSTGEATFTGVKVFKGSTVEYSVTGDLRSAIENAVSSPSGGVPSYYLSNDYMANKAKRINELGKVGDDVFAFITDIHWQLNAQHSPALMQYISDNCSVHKIFNGGDVSDNGVSLSDNTMIKVYDKYRKAIGKAYHASGNHDWFSPSNGKHLYYGMDSANNDQIGNPFMHYYYVDNVQQKIRYIVLNPFSREAGSSTLTVLYDTDQINWFTSTALDLPTDWDVLVFTHYLRATSVLSSGEYIETAIADFNSEESRTGKVLAVFQGHAHWDAVYHTTSGVPVITTTCDKWDLSNESSTIPPEGIAFREYGTIKEQAFDVVVLNREENKFTLVRIGAPAQDNVDKYRTDTGFTWIGTLEEREVSYAVT